ncbi:MAG: hypothetical protein U0168_22395 [Nannocystaceae bacterium]
MCDAQERCDCIDEGFPDRDACVESGISAFEAVADTPDLVFSRKCFERLLTRVGDVACNEQSPGFGIPCLAFRGTRDLGETCTTDAVLLREWTPRGAGGFLSWGQCKDNGVCEQGRCVASDTAEAVGAPCSLSRGRACEAGAFCTRQGTCTPRVEPGGTCDSPRSCESELASGGPEYFCAGISPDSSSPGQCALVTAAGSTCDQAQYESCGYGRVCRSSGQCQDQWPKVCAALSLAPDAYNPFDWIPD